MPTRPTRVYVAGPYRQGCCTTNVRRAIQAADDLTRFGYVPFLPHLNHFWDLAHGHAPQFWMNWDKEWLVTCDALYRIPGPSVGADNEVRFARELGIEVFYSFSVLFATLARTQPVTVPQRCAKRELEKLVQFIRAEIPLGQRIGGESAVDCAIRLLREAQTERKEREARDARPGIRDLPPTIPLQGLDWQVKLTTADIIEDVAGDDEAEYGAVLDWGNQRILVDSTLSPAARWRWLLHECVHAVNGELDEVLVESMSGALFATWQALGFLGGNHD